VFIPPTIHSAGSTPSPIKLTILQPAPVITEGRSKKMQASIMVKII
jgi:hypothetical protein